MPLQIFVGEKTVHKERRRLDLERVTRLVFSVGECFPACEVLLDNVRLDTAVPFANIFPKLLRLDLGLPSSPVQNGFVQLSAADWYRARRGYGVEPGSELTRTEDRRHPTDLLRDWVGFSTGGVAIDLPSDDYTVIVFVEDPG